LPTSPPPKLGQNLCDGSIPPLIPGVKFGGGGILIATLSPQKVIVIQGPWPFSSHFQQVPLGSAVVPPASLILVVWPPKTSTTVTNVSAKLKKQL
jgi:hypothetical protein